VPISGGVPGDHRVKRDKSSSQPSATQISPARPAIAEAPGSTHLNWGFRLDILRLSFLTSAAILRAFSFPPFKLDSAEVILYCISTLNQPPCSASFAELFLSSEQPPPRRTSYLSRPSTSGSCFPSSDWIAELYFPQRRRAFSRVTIKHSLDAPPEEVSLATIE